MKLLIPNGFALSALALLAGCASAGPSRELVDARQAYDRARGSVAQTYAPDRVLSAKQALDQAERAHADDPESSLERGLAYIALRKAELAEAYGSLLSAEKQRQTADQQYVVTQDRLRQEAEQRVSATERSLEKTQNTLAQARGELDSEKQARLKAEQEAAAAIASLQKIAQVKEESRGTVITLDGAVLFLTGKSQLLPLAQNKLDQVANALKDMDEGKTVLIEGHTDAQGSDESNLSLSQQRAEAVRSYLVTRGVPADRITAVGRGEQQPLASNDTAEGRANNRRVEIVIQPKR